MTTHIHPQSLIHNAPVSNSSLSAVTRLFGAVVKFKDTESAYSQKGLVVLPKDSNHPLRYAFALHENAHIEFTDFKAMTNFKSKLRHNIANALEDVRVNHLFSARFPGAAPILAEMNNVISAEVRRKGVKSRTGRIFAAILNKQFEDWSEGFPVESWRTRGMMAANTAELVPLVDEIEKALTEEEQQDQQQGENGEDGSPDESQQGENQGENQDKKQDKKQKQNNQNSNQQPQQGNPDDNNDGEGEGSDEGNPSDSGNNGKPSQSNSKSSKNKKPQKSNQGKQDKPQQGENDQGEGEDNQDSNSQPQQGKQNPKNSKNSNDSKGENSQDKNNQDSDGSEGDNSQNSEDKNSQSSKDSKGKDSQDKDGQDSDGDDSQGSDDSNDSKGKDDKDSKGKDSKGGDSEDSEDGDSNDSDGSQGSPESDNGDGEDKEGKDDNSEGNSGNSDDGEDSQGENSEKDGQNSDDGEDSDQSEDDSDDGGSNGSKGDSKEDGNSEDGDSEDGDNSENGSDDGEGENGEDGSPDEEWKDPPPPVKPHPPKPINIKDDGEGDDFAKLLKTLMDGHDVENFTSVPNTEGFMNVIIFAKPRMDVFPPAPEAVALRGALVSYLTGATANAEVGRKIDMRVAMQAIRNPDRRDCFRVFTAPSRQRETSEVYAIFDSTGSMSIGGKTQFVMDVAALLLHGLKAKCFQADASVTNNTYVKNFPYRAEGGAFCDRNIVKAMGLKLLQESSAKRKIIIMVTDGENEDNDAEAYNDIEFMRGMGLEVYAIGVDARTKARYGAGNCIDVKVGSGSDRREIVHRICKFFAGKIRRRGGFRA